MTNFPLFSKVEKEVNFLNEAVFKYLWLDFLKIMKLKINTFAKS